jgi:hypothetical protein
MMTTKEKKGCLISSNNRHKIYWDILIVVLLIFVCVVIPYRVTFIENEIRAWWWFFLLLDLFFLADMVITFLTTIQSKTKMIEITDKKEIAKEYLSMWFWIDLISIFPFDDLSKLITYSAINNEPGQGGDNANLLLRTLKIGKIGKMIRLMRLVKVFKILKNKNNLTAHFSKSLEINAGTERIFFSGLIFFFMNHVFGCAWVLIG